MKPKKFHQVIKEESEILLFGKYKYMTVQHILRIDPSYIIWLDAKKIVKFPGEIIAKAEDRMADMSHPYDEHTFGIQTHTPRQL